ncbi:hypothetical protein [Halobellus marinus]|uniref:hypothetical protein n=1 Tax=Halobellus TaxID=1073986 RepID=UPI0028A694CD|nr:hypothetical protein [Halobellus sp. DFY28]
MPLEQVAFDIETTGFEVDDEVTIVGFAVPLGVRVFAQTGDADGGADGLEASVRERTDEHVVVSSHASETELLQAVGEFVGERVSGEDTLLVAYNGERWRDGFDLPFLRTRLATAGIEWPFRDVPFADVMPVVTRRFNTRVDGEDQSDLVSVYGTLCDGKLNAVDPFAESREAVTAFEDGRFGDLVVHNVADVLRTRQLGRVAERFCAKSEFGVKSLTPTEYG